MVKKSRVKRPIEAPIISPEVEREQKGARKTGTALCLSGGGYRAMLFHAGTLWRLNEMGLLPELDRVSSVSGGSITAAVLGAGWSSLQWDKKTGVALNLDAVVIEPVLRLAGKTIDAKTILRGLVSRDSIAEKVAKRYRRHLFGSQTLQDLPDRPRFVINATNVQSGVLWRFSKPYMGDYRVGRIFDPQFELALAVAASSAFPPVLSPLVLHLTPEQFRPDPTTSLQRPPFTTRVFLSDGGVYDNLGLETAWKRHQRILVSDGGGLMQPQPTPRSNWAQHSLRVFAVINSQVRSLRKRQVISSFAAGAREGSYWGIWTPISEYKVRNPLPCPEKRTRELAATPTRLKSMPVTLRQQLINWGYAACDASVRKFVLKGVPAPKGFPYASAGV
jgi:NTE family protein